MEKINIAELLKDCPKGMELDCLLCNNPIALEGVAGDKATYPIRAVGEDGFHHVFTEYGASYCHKDAKCIIFPKGKTTWEGFVPPCKFKDGDVLVHTQNQRFVMSIYHKRITEIVIKTHCVLWDKDEGLSVNKEICCYVDRVRLATEEEKQKLFDAIKANGYKWNIETKTLEKLIIPKFKVGDWIVQKVLGIYKIVEVCESWYEVISYNNGIQYSIGFDKENDCHLWTIQDAKAGDALCTYECNEPKIVFILKGTPKKHYALSYHCYYNVMYPHFVSDSEKGCLAPNDEDIKPATKEQRDLLFQKMKEAGYKWGEEKKELKKIEPKFKVGDKIKTKVGTSTIETKSEKLTIIEIKSDRYIVEEVSGDFSVLSFVAQDYWELVSNKFDITTLKPFESKVLVRDKEEDAWHPAIWGCTGIPDIDTYPYIVIGGVGFEQCIPYEGNEHLSRTTNDCDEFYKTWE